MKKEKRAGSQQKSALPKFSHVSSSKNRSTSSESGDSFRSTDNHTNLNWCTGQRAGRKVQKTEESSEFVRSDCKPILILDSDQSLEMPSREFYESSHFYIDQLKGEYFTPSKEGWFEIKEDPAEDEEEEPQQAPVFAVRKNISKRKEVAKWTPEEHALFLEGLRIHGKVWPRVAEHIGTRDVKSAVSHGQKFLIRLLKFLETGESVDEMSIEDAEFFCGILRKKQHWQTNLKMKQAKAAMTKKEQGLIFEIKKHEKLKGNPSQPLAGCFKKEKPVGAPRRPGPQGQNYEKWKQEVVALEDEYEVCFSIKIKNSDRNSRDLQGNSGSQKLCFKSEFKYLPSCAADDSDSGASQGSRHMHNFSVDQWLPTFKDERLYRLYLEKVDREFKNLPDISSPEHAPLVIMQIGTGPQAREFEVMQGAPLGNVLTSFIRPEPALEEKKQRHPNLGTYLQNLYKQKMDKDELSCRDQEHYPVLEYLKSLTREEQETLLGEEITFFYCSHEEWNSKQVQALAEEVGKIDLEACTNSYQK